MNDVDFEQFIKLLDGALASDDKNVRNALKKFLFVAALALGDDTEPGPFTQMMETIDNLQRRISTLEQSTSKPHTTAPWITYTTPTVYPNIGTPGTAAGTTPYTYGSTTTSTSSSGYKFTNTTFGDDKTGEKLKTSIKGKLKGLANVA